MAASTVTGLSGIGMSYGLYKPETTSGCNCGKTPKVEEMKPIKTLCATRISAGGITSISVGSSSSIKTCK